MTAGLTWWDWETAGLITGGSCDLGCVCVWGCVGRLSEHEWVIISWVQPIQTPSTFFLLSWRLAATLYLHTSLLDQRTAVHLSLSLRLLIHCWNESPEWRWSLSVSVVEAALSHSLLWCSLSVYVGYVRLGEEWMMHASFTLLSSTTEQRQTICVSSWIFSAHSEH